jgi:hypothetical protein
MTKLITMINQGILSPLDIKNHTIWLCHITIKIFNKFIKMKLGIEISFDQFVRWNNWFAHITMYITKLALFFKQKPNDIPTNVFSIHIGPLWEANIDA